jgi:hypothetical protein
MQKLLIDNLGRIVGKVNVKRGSSGNREYGYRTNRGAEIRGIATLANISSIAGIDKESCDGLVVYEAF